MTDKAKARRKKLAAELGVSLRTAANIIAKKTAERRAATACGSVLEGSHGVACTLAVDHDGPHMYVESGYAWPR